MPAAPVVESSVREGEEPVKLPPTVQINKLSDKFREALARGDQPRTTKGSTSNSADDSPLVPEAKPTEKVVEKPVEKPIAPLTKRNEPAEKPVESKEPKIPREHFKVLETQRDEFKTKWEAAEARAKEIEAKAKESEAKIPADYEELKGKLTKHEEFMQKFQVEHSPQFQAAFDQKIAAGIEDAKEAVGTANADRVADLLSMPPSVKRDAEIDEITADLSPFRQAALVRAFGDVRKLQKERASELARSSENFKNLQNANAQQATREKLSRQEALERSYRVTLSEAAKQTVHFQRVEGNHEHNERVAENEKMLKEFTSSDLLPDDHAKLSLWAVRGIRSAQTDQIKDALIAKLQGELKAIEDAGPSLDGGGKGGDRATPKTVSQKYKEALEGGVPES